MHHVGRGDAAQRLDRLVVAPGGEAGPRQVVPEALRVIGIEAHRLPDPLDALFRLPQPGEHLALLDDDQVVVRVEAEGPPLVVDRQVVVLLDEVDCRQDAVHVAVVVVEGKGDFQRRPDQHLGVGTALAPVVDPGLAEHAGLPGVGVRIAGVELDRPLEQAQRPGVVLALAAMVQHLAGEDALVGRHVVGGQPGRAVARRRLDPPRQGGDDRGRDLVLDGEDVLEVAVVALGPEVVVGLGVDQLHGDAHPLPDLAHAAFDDVLHAELGGELLHLDRPALELERGVARDHEQLAEPRQLGDDVLGDAVGEELLLRVAAHVVERQHGDRRLVGTIARRAGLGRRRLVRRRGWTGARPSAGFAAGRGGSGRRAPARRCS